MPGTFGLRLKLSSAHAAFLSASAPTCQCRRFRQTMATIQRSLGLQTQKSEAHGCPRFLIFTLVLFLASAGRMAKAEVSGTGGSSGAFKSTVRLRTETRMPLCSQAEFSRLAQCLPGPFARTCRTEEGNLIEIDSLQMPTGVKKVLHELDLDSTGWHQTLVARCPKPGFKKPSVLRSVQ